MEESKKLMIKAATRGNTRADYLHSSGYAKAQNGGRIGAAGTGETFKSRQRRKREFLGRYSEARLTRESLNRARPMAPTATSEKKLDKPGKSVL